MRSTCQRQSRLKRKGDRALKNSTKACLLIFLAFGTPSIAMAYVELIAGAGFSSRQWGISLIMLGFSAFVIFMKGLEDPEW